jgi:serine protease Do
LVAETHPDGPAAKAGIVPGDVLVAIDAQPITDGADLAAKIGSMAPGTAVKIEILRNGNEHTLSVTLGELPGTPFKPAAAPQRQEPSRLGLTLAPAATIEGAGNLGVAVTEVDPNGLAGERGLSAGDIILDVSNNPVRTPADVDNAISRAKESGRRNIVMRVKLKNDGIQIVASLFPLSGRRFGAGSRVGSIRSDS